MIAKHSEAVNRRPIAEKCKDKHPAVWILTFYYSFVHKYIDTIQKKTEALLDASKEVGLEVNPEKSKYM
jgi:hypothetical protein